MKTNNTESCTLSQAFKRKTLYDPNPIRNLRINPIKHMIESKRYSWLELNCLDVLFERMNEKGYVVYTQHEGASEIGASWATFQSAERKAIEDNIIIVQRNYKGKTLGRISSYFNSNKVKQRLCTFLPSLAVGVFVGYNIFQLVRPIDINSINYDIYINTTKTITNTTYMPNPDGDRYGGGGSYSGFVSKKVKSEKGIGMEIPLHIKQIRSVDFTLAGQVCASIFGERVVHEIDSSMSKKRTSITNPQSYFFSAGHRICKQINKLPDYELARTLHAYFGTNPEMPLLRSLGKNPTALMFDIPSEILSSGKMDYTTTPRTPLRQHKPLPTGKPKNFNCPCHYRRKFNPDYVCYGVWCAQQELENMQAFLEQQPMPDEFPHAPGANAKNL